MNNNKKIILAMLCSILLLLAGCADKPKQTMRIGAVLWPGYEPLYLAGKLGYYDTNRIKVIDYLSNTDAIQSFVNHSLEAGAFTLDETLQLISQGADIDIVLIMDISNGGDVIMANNNIDNVEDLKGKAVAVERSAVGAFVLMRALQLHNMTIDDIHVVSTNAMEQISSFNKNQIVAAVSFDPYRTQLVKLGKKEIFNSTQIPNEIVDVLVVRKEFKKKHPELVQELTDVWFRTLEYQKQHPEESATYSLTRYDTTDEDYIAGLDKIKFATRQDNLQMLDNDESPLLKREQTMIEILRQLALLGEHKPLTLRGNMDKRFIH